MSFDWTTKRVLLTGGTGSFGQAFTERALNELPVKTICIFSRDELKQAEMRERFKNDKRLRFFVGDIRDKERVRSAMLGVDIVVHAAAMKRIEACEYNPMEAVKTNILGTQNLISEAIEAGVSHFMALSTDKAVKPITHYGATKLCMENLVVLANGVKGSRKTKLSCVRYGNVMGSRGSVIHVFKKQASKGIFTITDPQMTRFWITLKEAVQFVFDSIHTMQGGEVFTPTLPSFRIIDLAEALNPNAEYTVIGKRGVEKIHEEMLIREDGSVYDSGSNNRFLTVDELRELIKRI